MSILSLPEVQRICGDCTKCCEGWLHADIYGHQMHSGRPCFFLGKGCTIYENRPKDPCKQYTCAWLTEGHFPEWMKPSLSNVIITHRTSNDQPELSYYHVSETGSKIDSSVLNWLIHWSLNTKSNICYEVAGTQHVMGTAKFMAAVNGVELKKTM